MIRRMLLVSALIPLPLAAQIRASEVGSMTQIIDGTRIVMQYSRPQARGRDTLFGTRDMKWGHVWTPGANWATTFETNKNIKLNGRAVAKGKYSVWMKLNSATSWTMMLDPDSHQFHEDHPDSNAKQTHIPVVVDAAPFTEVLTWSMPAIRIDGGTLQFQWERARVGINLEVEPSLVMTFPAAEAAAYVGQYTYTEWEDGKPGKVMTFTVTHEDNTLKGQWDPEDPYFKKFALVRIAPDWFAPGVYDKSGKIYEVIRPEMTFEFTRKSGKAVSLVGRYDDDSIFAKAVRKP